MLITHSNIEHRNPHHGAQPRPSPRWEKCEGEICACGVMAEGHRVPHAMLCHQLIHPRGLVFSVPLVVEAVTETTSFSKGKAVRQSGTERVSIIQRLSRNNYPRSAWLMTPGRGLLYGWWDRLWGPRADAISLRHTRSHTHSSTLSRGQCTSNS